MSCFRHSRGRRDPEFRGLWTPAFAGVTIRNVGNLNAFAKPMRIFVNTFGTDIRLKQEVSLEPVSPALQDVLRALREQYRVPLERFLTEDLAPAEGAAVLVNGRNMWSLDRRGTTIKDGDELTFTVQVAGG